MNAAKDILAKQRVYKQTEDTAAVRIGQMEAEKEIVAEQFAA